MLQLSHLFAISHIIIIIIIIIINRFFVFRTIRNFEYYYLNVIWILSVCTIPSIFQ